jgi:hypothetical protein
MKGPLGRLAHLRLVELEQFPIGKHVWNHRPLGAGRTPQHESKIISPLHTILHLA